VGGLGVRACRNTHERKEAAAASVCGVNQRSAVEFSAAVRLSLHQPRDVAVRMACSSVAHWCAGVPCSSTLVLLQRTRASSWHPGSDATQELHLDWHTVPVCSVWMGAGGAATVLHAAPCRVPTRIRFHGGSDGVMDNPVPKWRGLTGCRASGCGPFALSSRTLVCLPQVARPPRACTLPLFSARDTNTPPSCCTSHS
jgi:hypothetical protein